MLKYKHTFIFLLSILFLGQVLLAVPSVDKKENDKNKNKINKTNTNDLYDFISVNQVKMWMSNNGDNSHDPVADGSGLFWPGGPQATISIIFEDGLIFGGKVNGEIRVGGSTYRHALQAGKILDDGTADDPNLEKYRIYKIRRDWENIDPTEDFDGNGIPDRQEYEDDYNNWPVEDGAPWVDVDGDGVFTRGVDTPEFVGDEVLWYVSNDLDASRTNFLYGTQPMGIEIQNTTFAFNRTGDLGDIVFQKYLMINKGTNTIEDMYVSSWSDTDLGFAGDDFSGCDTNLSLGYTYNGDNNDNDFYGPNPPAVGYDFFQGPIVPAGPDEQAKFKGKFIDGFKNLPMTGYAVYINSDPVYADPTLGEASGAEEMYNYMNSKLGNGDPYIDPHTGQEVNFVLAGDPVNGTGWYEGAGWPGGKQPDDRRHLLSSGPFTMAPGDTQEVVIGIIVARSSSNIKSVKELKIKDQAAQFAYDANFELPPSPPSPKLHASTGDKYVQFWWENNAEDYDNKFYKFEGYRIWQFRSLSSVFEDGALLDIFDLKNDIATVEDFVKIEGERIIAPVITANNSGIFRSLNVTTNAFTNTPLDNGTPYYYAVTSYAVKKDEATTPSFLESPPKIIEVIPGKGAIDYTTQFDIGDGLLADHSVGFGDGFASVKIIDPVGLQDATYDIILDSTVVNDTTGEKGLSYSIVNSTSGDTLVVNSTDFSAQDEDKQIVDGFVAVVNNFGEDSLSAVATDFRVRDIIEVVDRNGNKLDNPVKVNRDKYDTTAFASSGDWYIKPGGVPPTLLPKKFEEGLGTSYYEIRFTGTSKYYLTNVGFSAKTDKNSLLGEGVLPFEVWDIGRDVESTVDDKRLIVKILDKSLEDGRNVEDGKWTFLEDGSWEEIFVYEDPDLDPANLPDESGTSLPIDHKFGQLKFVGNIPAEGSGAILRLRTYKSLDSGDQFKVVMNAANFNDLNAAKDNMDRISVYPNPYFGSNQLEIDKYRRFVRFVGLPSKATIRIFNLAGVYINKIEKDNLSEFVDWNLLNKDAIPVASGMYLAYIEMPGVGTKVLKLAIIQEQQYIDRL